MTATPAEAAGTAVSPPAPRAPVEDGAERGHLRIDRSVLRKLAEYAADQACGGVRPRSRVPGRSGRGPRAQLSGPDYALRVRVQVAVRYAEPAPEAVARVRERIRTELRRHAQAEVRSVDVTITDLVPAAEAPRVR
ncbi:Asp23/Gls24 family envelope stress response protein [Salinifilum ghardaiensis]